MNYVKVEILSKAANASASNFLDTAQLGKLRERYIHARSNIHLRRCPDLIALLKFLKRISLL